MNKKLLSILTAVTLGAMISFAPGLVFAGEGAACKGAKAASCSGDKAAHPDCHKEGMTAKQTEECLAKEKHAGKSCSGEKTADAHANKCKGEKSCGAAKSTH